MSCESERKNYERMSQKKEEEEVREKGEKVLQ